MQSQVEVGEHLAEELDLENDTAIEAMDRKSSKFYQNTSFSYFFVGKNSYI